MTTLSKFIRLFNPVVLIAIAAFLIPVIIIEVYVLQHTGGTFSYALDDTFIHLAIAKNLAFNHIWSTNPYEFASASSSILYPIILAALFEIFGAQTALPFIVNVVAAITLIIALQQWLQRQEIGKGWQIAILLGVIYLTPLPVLVISGMEHTIQVLFCFLFIAHFTDAMGKWANQPILQADGAKTEFEFPRKVYWYGALMVASRYECVTLVGIACIIVALNRKYWQAFQLAFLSLLPIIVFGIYSLFKGSYFIPNSVLLKSEAPPLTFIGILNFLRGDLFWRLAQSRAGYNTIATQRLLFILPISLLLFWKPLRVAKSYYYFLVMLLFAVLAHLAFAATAKFPRFEAYLIGCSVIIVGLLLAKFGKEAWEQAKGYAKWYAIATVIFFIYPLFMRGIEAFSDIGRGCINIYEQQYQMGKFVRSHYYWSPVAINDLGAISYFSEGKNLDMVGLGNLNVARSREKNYWGADFLYALNKKEEVQIAIIYDFWFPPELTQSWTKIASWKIPYNITCGSDKVYFFAVDTAASKDLAKNLHDFQRNLPRDVTVQYY